MISINNFFLEAVIHQIDINIDANILVKFIVANVIVVIADMISYPADTVKRKLMMQSHKSQK